MRDIILVGLLLVCIPLSLMRPFLGACIFAWLALMNPHKLTWGIAESIPWSLIYGIVTLAGLAAHRDKLVADSMRRFLPVIIYVLWMVVTSAFALRPEGAWMRFDGIWKVQLMCLATLCLLVNERRLMIFVPLLICSIAFYGLKGGVFTVTSGGSYKVWGPVGTAIADNNHLAAALVITLPLLYWLYRVATARWQRLAVAFTGTMTMFSIFGSHSRGAFLAIFLMSAFLWLRSDRKLVLLLLLPVALAGTAAFMPTEYWERIATIQEYESDGSAMGRINTWQTALNIANSRITGAGLEYYSSEVFARYAPDPTRVHSSHNIFFQSLGEQGWIGLTIFLWIFGGTWRRCSRLAKMDWESPLRPALLARMMQVSLVGFATAGFFVNIGNWDFMYYLVAVILAIDRLAEARAPEPATRPLARTRAELAVQGFPPPR